MERLLKKKSDSGRFNFENKNTPHREPKKNVSYHIIYFGYHFCHSVFMLISGIKRRYHEKKMISNHIIFTFFNQIAPCYQAKKRQILLK